MNCLKEISWLNPVWIIGVMLLPVYLLSSFFDFSSVNLDSYLESNYYWLGFLLLACIVVGAVVSFRKHRGGEVHFLKEMQSGTRPLARVRKAFWIFAITSIVAYLIWFADVIMHPELVVNILIGAALNIRDDVSTIPGVTTLTQLGVPAVIAFMTLYLAKAELKKEKYVLGVLAFLTLCRVVLWSERLALIEVLLPAGLVAVHRLRAEQRSAVKLVKTAPIFGLVFLLIFFGVAEYFRSWNHYQMENDSFFQFLLSRIISYYATSINNGVGFVSLTDQWPYLTGDMVLNFLYKMPVVKDFIELGGAYGDFGSFLTDYANVEFNNPCGLFMVVSDLGIFGGVVFFLIYGYVLGRSYLKFIAGDFGALVFYPVLFVSLLEVFRFFYFSDPRAVYVIAGCWALVRFTRVKPAAAKKAQEVSI